jgi:import receptor subunit TOM70
MSNNTFPAMTPAQNVVIDTSSLSASSSSSVWDRISNWVSENKAVVYTVAGIAVVVTGGTVYYLSTSSQEPSAPRKSKKERRKEKKKAEEEKKVQQEKPAAEGKFDVLTLFCRAQFI